jgi:hypothetical protein
MNVNEDNGDAFKPALLQPTLDWYNTYLAKHIKSLKVVAGNDRNNRPVISVYFSDGSIMNCCMGFTTCTFFLDQKAYENRKDGVNMFVFYAGRSTKEFFGPYDYKWNGTRAGLMSRTPDFGCNANVVGHAYCAKLIQYDGWEIKDDYPFKF